MLNKQEVFDLVLNHLRQQGRPALRIHGLCAYRAPDGAKCAIGALIADEYYDPGMEGFGVTDKFNKGRTSPVINALRRSGWAVETEQDFDFLHHLQTFLHDRPSAEDAFMVEVERAATEIAATYGLTYVAPGSPQ
ncbi:hypothetical protein SAMN06295937_100799 [Sphingopyxis flava]|uniref:Uncharacterized protein n=1 Tax=Sphingopyxis flava TaxID=1507287 RepID=A0A1T5BSE3_9SPHN|nr:hypothetical protein SAMN06295937_100799 [Sphingopyxis flava]